ncbi:MAG: carbohydrate kinase family protein [Candidatus Acidiferrum sp.]|jgi:sugar/nucleoside kinase (ribokinase family)
MIAQTDEVVACIGGVVVDRKARVIEPLHPGTSNPVTVRSCPGGVVCNIARNLAKLGCRTAIFSVVGRDAKTEHVLDDLETPNLDLSGLSLSSARPTASYTAVLDERGQLFIGLADMAIFEELDEAWADSIASAVARCRFWILDANLPAATIERLLRANKGGATVLVDPISVAKAARVRHVLNEIDVLFPNAKEAAVLSGHAVATRDDLVRAAAEIRRLGVGTVIVTLGEDGIYLDNGKQGKFIQATPARKVSDVTGAGDALVAGYAYAMIAGERYEPALWGLAAASLTVETEESIAPNLGRESVLERIEASLKRSETGRI